MVTDPIADYLTRIRNAIQVGYKKVTIPYSRMKENISKVLKDNNYINDFQIVEIEGKKDLKVYLRYLGKKNAIYEIKKVSKPGRRVYFGKAQIPYVKNGMGIGILSTTKGIMADKDARKDNLGGEYLCTVW